MSNPIFVDIPMSCKGVVAVIREIFYKLIGNGYTSMFSAGTAYAYNKIRLALRNIVWKQKSHHIIEASHKIP